jgi:hypothetical protein
MARHNDQNAFAVWMGELVMIAAADIRPVLALKAGDNFARRRFQMVAPDFDRRDYTQGMSKVNFLCVLLYAWTRRLGSKVWYSWRRPPALSSILHT